MLHYVYNQHEDVARFVAQLIPDVRELGFGRCKAIGVVDASGRAIAGVVYHNWQPRFGVIEMSAAATTPRWLTRETLQRIYDYPFEQLQVQMVMKLVSRDDERLLDQLARGGYVFYRFPRAFGRDRDGVICELTSEAWAECKFNSKRKPEPGMAEFNAWLNEEAA